MCGGAPFNLACGLRGLGLAAACMTRVNASDAAGAALLAQANRFGLPTDWIQRDTHHASGVVDVKLSSAGQPHYTIKSPAAWDFIARPNCTRAGIAAVRVLCWGSLALRSPGARSSIFETIEAHPKTLKFLDLNLRPTGPDLSVLKKALAYADWLKVNDDELETLARQLGMIGAPTVLVRALAQRFELKRVAVTLGARGCMVFDAAENRFAHVGAAPLTKLVDTVGAGDAFSAGWLATYLLGVPLESGLQFANAFAAATCAQRGPVSEDPSFFTHWQARLLNRITPP